MVLRVSILDDFPRTTVTVATYRGTDSNGDLYATPVSRQPMVEDKRRQVRSSTGELTVSETTLYDELTAAAVYAVGSQVTVNGRVCTVIVCARNDIDDPNVDHVAVALT